MTIETTTNRISYTGSGTTGPFSFPYYFLADGDLTVIKTTIADGTEETLTLTTDYTISGAGEAAGGSVTLVATLSSSYKLTIIRDPDILQPADYPANDRFPAATHEEALDRATMIMQRLKDYIDRSFRLSDGDVSGISLILSNLSAGNLIAVNAAGDGIESIAAVDVDLTTVSAFIQTLFNDADAATARNTLGAAALGANTFTGLQTFAAGADIASATTVDLTAATGNLVRITGTTATTGVTINNGQVVLCYPTGAWPLTYHATNMPIKGGASYTCAAGDTVIFSKDGNGSLHVDIFKADGTAVVAGPAIQVQTFTRFTTGGSSTAYTLTPVPAITANATGQRFRIAFHTAAGTTPTLAVSGQTALNLKYKDSTGAKQAVTSTQIPTSWSADVENDGTDWVVLNTPNVSGGITLGTPVATTSGTSVEITGIASGTKLIVIDFTGVSTNGTSALTVRIGDSGGIEPTGYDCAVVNITTGGTVTNSTGITSGFQVSTTVVASETRKGMLILSLQNSSSNTWQASGDIRYSGSGTGVDMTSGNKSLSAELDRFSITTVGGANTFDAGEINYIVMG